jgi:hypothetical protein
VRITIHGDVPPEQWNRLGTRLIPRLRTSGALSASIALACDVEASAVAAVMAELEQTLQDLALADRLRIDQQ